jgi:hypothetical protein
LPTTITFLVGGFIATVDQYWIAYHVTILFAALLVVECFFLPETLYPRQKVVASELARTSNTEKSEEASIHPEIDIKRTKELGYFVSKHISKVKYNANCYAELWKDPRRQAPKTMAYHPSGSEDMDIPNSCHKCASIYLLPILVVSSP